jgi:Ankyrin repeats (3 copies)
MRASQEGHLDISDILLGSGADVNRKNHEGMNALMLASQRGHGAMVLLLIKSDAAMDEQTAQGSTALMLACKRGHAKCVEVLVAMGAEIYIRDIRSRTAWDTATKRGYMELLQILNTQLQVRRTQEYRHAHRTVLLLDFRALHQKGRLRLSGPERNVQRLTLAVKTVLKAGDCGSTDLDTESADNNFSSCSIDSNAMEVADSAPLQNSTSRAFSPSYTEKIMTIQEARLMVSRPENAIAVQALTEFLTSTPSSSKSTEDSSTCSPSPSVSNPLSSISPIRPRYALWQWPLLLQRCMDLPPGVFELIADMLPMPRVWHWSILRLKRRCKLAPHQAVCDINIIMDEILTDACIFPGPQQSLLVRISQNPQVSKTIH